MTDNIASIESITFADDTKLELSPGNVVVIVGPNNVGKSQSLRNIHERITTRKYGGYRIVKNIVVKKDNDKLKEWINNFIPTFYQNGVRYVGRSGGNLQYSQVESEISKYPNTSQPIGNLMTLFANSEERLKLANKTQPIDLSSRAPSNPVQALYRNSSKLEKLSEACKDAFGFDITFDHLYDGFWRLRLGRLNEMEVDRHGFPKEEFREKLGLMASVDDQGDGIRSYIGLLSEFQSLSHLFVLLDEPEAFLHPPQVRRLSKRIMEIKSINTQLIVATHDPNFVKGLLDTSYNKNIVVVRIQRSKDDVTTTNVLPSEELQKLWDDPILKYSNVLEGLFHNGVIVCEGDPDCRLYESIIDTHNIGRSGTEFMFVQAGGLERIDKIVTALRAIDVPTQVIVDADALSKKDIIARILKSMGFDFEQIEPYYRRLESEIISRKEKINAIRVKREIDDIFNDITDDLDFDSNLSKKIKNVIKIKSGWQEFKDKGKNIFKAQQLENVNDLFSKLSEFGVHVVPYGELESWFPEAYGKSNYYVADIHEKRIHEDEQKCRNLIEFLRKIINNFS